MKIKNSLNCVRKELDKIFRNPRLIFSTFILPGLIIFLMYTFMGSSFTNQNESKNETKIICLINSPNELVDEALKTYKELSEEQLNLQLIDYSKSLEEINEEVINEFKKQIDDKAIHAYIFFEKDFKAKIESYKNKETTILPLIKYYANTTISISSSAMQDARMLTNIICEKMNERVVGVNEIELADDKELQGQVLGMLLPMLILVFVFAGGLSVGPDAIAGEKERGTIATLLMAPIKKEEIVLGKIISTVIVTILSAIGSFIGIALSLPNMGGLFGDATITSYSFVHYMELLLIIVLIATMASSLFLVASTLGKSTKEATAYSLPIYILAMVIGASTMFKNTIPTNFSPYLIPIYNLTIAIKGVFLNQLTTINLLTATASTIIYFFVILFVVAKLFKSERLMFAK